MTILLDNYEMPSTCSECFALDECGDYPRCIITGETRGYTFMTHKMRMHKCPLRDTNVVENIQHGHWIPLDNEEYQCSNCGDTWFIVRGDPIENGYDYCPHCGVPMMHEEEIVKYIKVDEAIKHLAQMQWHDDGYPIEDYDEKLQYAKDWLNGVSTVDVEPVRHGHWIDNGTFFTCSVCKEEQYGVDTGRFYCPNCGAKMDEDTTNSIKAFWELGSYQLTTALESFEGIIASCSECGYMLDTHEGDIVPEHCPRCGVLMTGIKLHKGLHEETE